MTRKQLVKLIFKELEEVSNHHVDCQDIDKVLTAFQQVITDLHKEQIADETILRVPGVGRLATTKTKNKGVKVSFLKVRDRR